jgi:hypothetical protein
VASHAGKGRSGQRPDLEVRGSRPNFFRDSVFLQLVTYSCDPDVADNGRVVLKLPPEVDISSHLRVWDGHDRNEGLDLSDPLRVLLTGCEIDGSAVACQAFNVRLQSGNLVVTPSRFKESEKKQVLRGSQRVSLARKLSPLAWIEDPKGCF